MKVIVGAAASIPFFHFGSILMEICMGYRSQCGVFDFHSPSTYDSMLFISAALLSEAAEAAQAAELAEPAVAAAAEPAELADQAPTIALC